MEDNPEGNNPPDWYWRMGVHHAYNPTLAEEESTSVKLVVDTLIAYPVDSLPPRIHLLNPFTWEPGPNPLPLEVDYRRPHTPDQYGEVWAPSQVGASDVLAIKIEDRLDHDEMGNDLEVQEDEVDDEDDIIETRDDHIEEPISKKRKMDVRSSLDPDESDREILILPTPTSMPAPTPSDAPPPPSNDLSSDTHPWSLTVKKQDLEKALSMTKLSTDVKTRIRRSKRLFKCVAISPRGAKWVIAVGDGESMGIWRLRDKSPKV